MRVPEANAGRGLLSHHGRVRVRVRSGRKAFGTSDDEKKLLEFNARTQVTMWGPPLFSQNRQHTAIAPGSPQDYAAKTQVVIGIFLLE